MENKNLKKNLDESTKMSRRGFIKTASFAAGAAGAAMFGATQYPKQLPMNEVWRMQDSCSLPLLHSSQLTTAGVSGSRSQKSAHRARMHNLPGKHWHLE